MKPPYVRRLNYLSYSSLKHFEKDPVGFYLERLGPFETRPPREPSQYPFSSSVGSAFDGLIKLALRGLVGIETDTPTRALERVDYERDKSLAMAGQMLALYAGSGALGWLLLEGPLAVEQRIDGPIDGVPCRVQIDCVLRGKVVLDWKTAGANNPASGPPSPTPGYVRLFDSREAPMEPPKAHKKAGINFEEIDEEWATQLVFGQELIGGPPAAGIDQLIVLPEGHLRVAQFRGVVGDTFRADVRARIKKAWSAIEEERVVPEGLTIAEAKALRG